MLPDPDTYLAQVEERFATSTDFTIGLEEEFQILDPGTLALTGGFELLRDSAPRRLRERIARRAALERDRGRHAALR